MLSAPTSDSELLALQREQEIYGDLIMSDLVESYNNLVHKVRLFAAAGFFFSPYSLSWLGYTKTSNLMYNLTAYICITTLFFHDLPA